MNYSVVEYPREGETRVPRVIARTTSLEAALLILRVSEERCAVRRGDTVRFGILSLRTGQPVPQEM